MPLQLLFFLSRLFIFSSLIKTVPEKIAAIFVIISALLYLLIQIRTYLITRKINQIKLKPNGKDKLNVHLVSETEYVTQGQGVHTAFVEMLQLFEGNHNINVVVNDRGWGNVFHSHTYGPYYFWKGLPYKGKRILTAHVIPDSSRGTIPFWKTLLPLTTLYLKMVYAFADVVIAISPTVEKKICELKTSTKVVRIHNPVLVNNWERTAEGRFYGRRFLKINDHEKVVLGVGQLQERKGVEDFIDIAAALPQYKFVWAGGRPWGRFTEGISRINDKIEKAPANIIFTGLLDVAEMPKIYAAADLFLFPSYQENCPLAPLEAASAGLPVVYRDLAEYRSLYTANYLRARDTAGFIAQTINLLEYQPAYAHAVKISAELVNEFDKNKIELQLINLYKETARQC